MANITPSKCQGCGATIIFAKTREGRVIPLDPKPKVYRNTGEMAGPNTPIVEAVKGSAVTHFATCSNVNDFSKGSKWRTSIDAIAAMFDDEVLSAMSAWSDKPIEPDADRKGAVLANFTRRVHAMIASAKREQSRSPKGKTR